MDGVHNQSFLGTAFGVVGASSTDVHWKNISPIIAMLSEGFVCIKSDIRYITSTIFVHPSWQQRTEHLFQFAFLLKVRKMLN